MLDEIDDLLGQFFRCIRYFDLEDFEFAFCVRVIDPEIETAALDRIVDFTRPVRRDDDDRRLGGLDCADLGDGYLKIRQDFEQECFERLIRAVELIDQQDRPGAGGA